MHMHGAAGGDDARFDTSIAGLPAATPTPVVDIADGDTFDIEIAPVRNQVGDATLRMLAYNGSIPGPTLRVRQHSTVFVNASNATDAEQTVHWHGLRLDNRFDGVPYETQKPILPGERFTYELRFPDPGLYWYHPHIREDYGQEMGLYANIVVDPADGDYWPRVDREVVITVDDVLLQDGRMPPFHRSGATHTMMGRFGNVMLTAGSVAPTFPARQGEVVRLYLTNTANVRVFNLALPGAQMKLVGGDSGRVEHERMVDAVLLSPSERAVVDVLFDQPRDVVLEQRTPLGTTALATFAVASTPAPSDAARAFRTLRHDPELVGWRAGLRQHLERQPDRVLRIVGEMLMGSHDHGAHAMHEMSDDTPQPSPHGVHGAAPAADGIEWEDEMPEMNAMSDATNMAWRLIDTATGAVNHEIDWTFRVGEQVKIRLDNRGGGDHEMHHPFHIHGAGRFLVVARDGAEESNLVWKDSVLVRGGEVVDLLLDVTNPGRWMAHCHIAEHIEAGMMFSFDVVAA